MRRFVTLLFMMIFTLSSLPTAQSAPKNTAAKSKQKPPCVANWADCPDVGCGGQFDPNLNQAKNLPSVDGEAKLHSLTWMKKLEDPENFSQGDSREELQALGEGQSITVVAYLLRAKAELGGESCNCGFHTAAETDNHLVLVSKTTVDKFPGGDAAFSQREPESETAEFTPRVRKNGHPNFTREVVQPLIDDTDEKALLVRVTGQLMFDSEHFIRNHLVRVNNWEIHPIVKLEYCETGNTCKATSDSGWKSLDDVHPDDAQ
jgi:hypothetical protein